MDEYLVLKLFQIANLCENPLKKQKKKSLNHDAPIMIYTLDKVFTSWLLFFYNYVFFS